MSNYFLVYASYSTENWGEEELTSLLTNARRHNEQLGITGMLVYLRNRFIQVLEGDQLAVIELYEKIKKDPRHRDSMILLEGILDKRNFSEWSMGFQKVEDDKFEELTGFTDIEKFIEKISESHPVITFLKMFYTKNFKKK